MITKTRKYDITKKNQFSSSQLRHRGFLAPFRFFVLSCCRDENASSQIDSPRGQGARVSANRSAPMQCQHRGELASSPFDVSIYENRKV
jgi:hypothetical protein